MSAGHVLTQQCQTFQLGNARSRADGSRSPTRAAKGLTYSSSVGEAFTTCEKSGHRFEAYVYSQGELLGQPGRSGIWKGKNMYVCLKPADDGTAAGIVLSHIVRSIHPCRCRADLPYTRGIHGKRRCNANLPSLKSIGLLLSTT